MASTLGRPIGNKNAIPLRLIKISVLNNILDPKRIIAWGADLCYLKPGLKGLLAARFIMILGAGIHGVDHQLQLHW